MLKVLPFILLLSLASNARAEIFSCSNRSSTAIDKFGVTSGDAPRENSAQERLDEADSVWIVDTERGWRRSDVPNYRGSCVEDRGYTVCRANDIAFGEAIFSLHPDKRNFVLVYLDYGLDALAFAGLCSRSEEKSQAKKEP